MRKSVVHTNEGGGDARAKQTRSTVKRYRVYFNRRGAPKGQIWCVDQGEGTRRRYFDSVTIKVAELKTKYNGKEPDWKNPIAWIEVEGVLTTWGSHQMANNHAGISNIRPKK